MSELHWMMTKARGKYKLDKDFGDTSPEDVTLPQTVNNPSHSLLDRLPGGGWVPDTTH